MYIDVPCAAATKWTRTRAEMKSDFMTATDSIGDWMKNALSCTHISLENGTDSECAESPSDRNRSNYGEDNCCLSFRPRIYLRNCAKNRDKDVSWKIA
jgi:hypothetical protein